MAYLDGWKSLDSLHGKDASSTTLEQFRGEDASATAQKVQGEDKLNNNGKFRGEKAYAIYWENAALLAKTLRARTQINMMEAA